MAIYWKTGLLKLSFLTSSLTIHILPHYIHSFPHYTHILPHYTHPPSLYTSSLTIYTPSLTIHILPHYIHSFPHYTHPPSLYTSSLTIYTPSLTIHILPHYTHPPSLYTLLPSLYTHPPSLYTELAKVVYGQNAKLVTRQVLPVMWHLLAGKPPGSTNAKAAVVSLCETLFNTMGQSFLDSAASLPPQSQQRLDQILQSRTFS